MTAEKKSNRLYIVIAIVALGALALPCCGITAAVAIPAMIGYLARSKTSEAEANLRALHQLSAAYYEEEHLGADGRVLTHCAVDSAVTSNVPSSSKALLGPLPPGFEALGFAVADPVYYQYEIVSAGGCEHAPGDPLYSFRAYGDLDGDGATSLYELSSSSDAGNHAARAPGIFREAELE